MKKLLFGLGLALLLSTPLLAQEDTYIFESTHYRVRSHLSMEHAELAATKMEALATLYNSFFHFDTQSLGHKLRVQIFDSKRDFDRYLLRLIGETRDEFVYLHYNDVSRSELVGYAVDDSFSDKSIAHQGFVQFLRSFIANPPLWIREGFAVYFEDAEIDLSFGAAINRENLSWLETLKDILFGSRQAEALTPEEILAIDVESARDTIDVFYPEAWGVVHYLLNSPIRSHNRILWSSISAMEPRASLQENSRRVVEAAFRWVPQDDLLESFLTYFQELNTYRELIEAGVSAYERGDLFQAESYFVQAIDRQDTSYIPYYYLGLINYDRENFALAQFNYKAALDRGADEAITLYALGVNAFADNRFTEAQEFLQQTVRLDPATFETRAALILQRMEY